jgi:hypothetical protein
MSRIHPECPNAGPFDRSLAADVLLRQEPDEEEDEEEEEGDAAKKMTRMRARPTTAIRSEHAIFISVVEG